MKKLFLLLSLGLLLTALSAQMTTPRTYIQKVTLDSGALLDITNPDGKSAPEYIVEAWIPELENTYMSTEKDLPQSVCLKLVGDDVRYPKTCIISVQLGNFKAQWAAGQTLHLKVTHKASKESVAWHLVIPEGTSLIRHLDDARVLPPKTKK